MKNIKIFRSILVTLFLIFLALYFSSNAGLIDYQAKHQTVMTEESIKQFEDDVRNGNDIDVKKYVKKNDKEYDNFLSRETLKLSNSIGKGVEGILKFVFKKFEKVIDD